MRKIQWWKKREENMAKQKRVAVRKDRKGMTNEKKNYWTEGNFYSVFHQASYSQGIILC